MWVMSPENTAKRGERELHTTEQMTPVAVMGHWLRWKGQLQNFMAPHTILESTHHRLRAVGLSSAFVRVSL